MNKNVFFGDTSNIIIEVKRGTTLEEIEILKSLHPNAEILETFSKEMNYSKPIILDSFNLSKGIGFNFAA